IHRGIGVHHAAALRRGVPFRVNVFVGGPPAMTLAAVMPLPEGLPGLTFAGALGGRRVPPSVPPPTPPPPLPPSGEGEQTASPLAPWWERGAGGVRGLPIAADADFCISGTVDPTLQLPEGPFGDHLGYYSLAHDFPVLNVERVYHRTDAVWPF